MAHIRGHVIKRLSTTKGKNGENSYSVYLFEFLDDKYPLNSSRSNDKVVVILLADDANNLDGFIGVSECYIQMESRDPDPLYRGSEHGWLWVRDASLDPH